ncbi:MAG: TonB-dependent receptor, partial [Gemmatimonadetes bacterium]|nr:TonB-dependent receptor [Gemmatimonadota bacterium]
GGGGGGGPPPTYDVRDVAEARTQRRYGIALEYELRPTPNSGVTLGWAHDRLARDSAGADAADAFVGAAHYDLAGGTRLRVSAARRFHFPTLRQLYDVDGGNPGLRTETAVAYEAGVEQALPGEARAGLTLFRTDAHDFIERAERGGPFQNFQAYRFTGLELSGEVRPVERLWLRGAYTYMDTQDRSPGADREALQYRPRHQLALGGDYRFAFGLRAYAAARHVAGQAFYSRQPPVQRRELPAFTVVDLRLTQRLAPRRLEAYLGADNLLDAAYEEEYGNPQAKRTIYGGLTFTW